MSAWQAAHGFREPRYDAHLVGIRHEREELDRRIDERIRGMLEAGWVEEVRSLAERGYGRARAMRSVGYRQVMKAISAGEPIDVDALAERAYRATRVFARRQRTWLRDQPVRWLSAEEARRATVERLL